MTISLGIQFIPVGKGISVESIFYVIFKLIQHISK